MVNFLLVDAQAIIRDLLAKLVDTDKAYRRVGDADNGALAIDRARTLRPDVILMSRTLPDMDGLSAAEQILDELPGTVIIILAANPDPEKYALAQAQGVSRILPSPFEMTDVLGAIQSALA